MMSVKYGENPLKLTISNRETTKNESPVSILVIIYNNIYINNIDTE